MWKGEVVSVHIAPEAGHPMETRDEVRAIAGKGIEGDRYIKGIGFFSHNKGPHRQVTLFESEVLDTLKRDNGTELTADECRMNIVTRGVPLTHLVGKRFRVGKATLRGVRLNEPCKHLEEVVGKKVIEPLIHRCGLFAEVLEGGWIKPGDAVQEG
ncbi:MAG: MOSC domain-containing protein [Nitrospinota bacterium]